ncbi:ABC transporter ATP-binding protein [Alkalihalobacillus pseudalcaliphilus]|uniref:ABC transporter ATP-binding protein n=1 Tax=Alkalihalobacillus pseudalcaliphilus TaxID=79884 RepID=UPI00064DA357|nr:ABC transporter ATP-binding protein [Alkalihalobacillus pseudalcaliphilus]KMK78169.1 ABC transporter ATP-binding protein [Alkalihalobacillus pseudalcaliphilus]
MTVEIATKNLNVQLGTFHLNDATIDIPKGKMTAIIGPNGSGKSTLLKALTQLVGTNTGSISIKEKDIHDYKRKEFARTVAMLPQSKQSFPNLTVQELIAYGRSPYKRFFEKTSLGHDQEIIQWAMEITNTQKHADRLFHTLSGGEQQKVRIALALAQKTDILLLDEPTTFLDVTHQIELMELLEQIQRKFSMTIVMVLHELQQAATYCDYVITVKNGSIRAAGNPVDLLTSAFIKDIYNIDVKILFDDGLPLIIPVKGQFHKTRLEI